MGRARLYALSKMAQEAIVRFYDEMSNKIFGIIRMGTVFTKKDIESVELDVRKAGKYFGIKKFKSQLTEL